MKIFLLEIFTALSLAASSAMRLRSLHSWLIASMQADDLIPNNWNGVKTHVLKPLVGQSPHHIKNTAEFADKIKDCRVEEDEVQVSHDVVALFTSVPVDRATVIIRQRLLDDNTLNERTNASVKNITELLTWVLYTTYFVYQGIDSVSIKVKFEHCPYT